MKNEKLILCIDHPDSSDFFHHLQGKMDEKDAYKFHLEKRIYLKEVNKYSNVIILIKKDSYNLLNFRRKLKSNTTVVFFEIRNLYDLMMTAVNFGVAFGKLDHLFPGVYSFDNCTGSTSTVV